jgi:lipopolysaccharide transport system ATP-binding protein
VIKDGPPEEVMDFYNALIAERENATVEVARTPDGRAKTHSGTGEATVEGIRLLDSEGVAVESVDVGAAVTLQIDVAIHAPVPRLVFGFGIRDRLGQVMYGTNTHLEDMPVHNLKPGDRVVYRIRFAANLGPGSYSIQTALTSSETHLGNNYEWQDLALIFNMVNLSRTHFAGCNYLAPTIEIEQS